MKRFIHVYSHWVFCPVVIIMCFAKLVFKGAGQLIKKSNFLTVLQETCGCGSLVWKKMKP